MSETESDYELEYFPRITSTTTARPPLVCDSTTSTLSSTPMADLECNKRLAWPEEHTRLLLMNLEQHISHWPGRFTTAFINPIINEIRQRDPNFTRDREACMHKLRNLAISLETGSINQSNLQIIDQFTLRTRLCRLFRRNLHHSLKKGRIVKRSHDQLEGYDSDLDHPPPKKRALEAAAVEDPPAPVPTVVPMVPAATPQLIGLPARKQDHIDPSPVMELDADEVSGWQRTPAVIPVVPPAISPSPKHPQLRHSLLERDAPPRNLAAAAPRPLTLSGSTPVHPSVGIIKDSEYHRLTTPMYHQFRDRIARASDLLFEANLIANQLLGLSAVAPASIPGPMNKLIRNTKNHYLGLNSDLINVGWIVQHHIHARGTGESQDNSEDTGNSDQW